MALQAYALGEAVQGDSGKWIGDLEGAWQGYSRTQLVLLLKQATDSGGQGVLFELGSMMMQLCTDDDYGISTLYSYLRGSQYNEIMTRLLCC